MLLYRPYAFFPQITQLITKNSLFFLAYTFIHSPNCVYLEIGCYQLNPNTRPYF